MNQPATGVATKTVTFQRGSLPWRNPQARLQALYGGAILHFDAKPSARALVDFVWSELAKAFPECDPRQAQFTLSPQEFFARVSALRVRLREDPRSKPLIRAMLQEFGCDLTQSYCDFLRLRAEINWYQLFHGLIHDFSVKRVAANQAKALEVAGLEI